MVAVSSQHRRRGFTLVEMLVVIVIIGILASLLLPVITHVLFRAKVTTCINNQRELYRLGTVYSSSHKGNWPSAKAEELWLSLRRLVPPLIAEEQAAILHCSVLEHELGPDETNYRGPIATFGRTGVTDPLGADKPGNHGDAHGGCVLFKDGSVQEYELDHLKWQECATKLSP